MRQKSTRAKEPAEKTVRDIRRRTRKQYSAEEKIRIVLEGLRGEDSIAALCRREGIAESLYYSWSFCAPSFHRRRFLTVNSGSLEYSALAWSWHSQIPLTGDRR